MACFLAEEEGFEPPCLSANGFQDRLVMTTSILLRAYFVILHHLSEKCNIFNIKKFYFTVKLNFYLKYTHFYYIIKIQ